MRAILFDFDGTLMDTAPHLIGTLNTLLAQHQRPPVDPITIRPVLAYGSFRILKEGFGITEQAANFKILREEYLTLYQQNLMVNTELFPGFNDVFAWLKANQIKWGIVTNKPERLTLPLLELIDMAEAPAVVVCGDTLSVAKPNPEPLLHACELIGESVDDCLFVGDTEVDALTGQNAGVKTLLVEYGYHPGLETLYSWPAAGIIKQPQDLIQWLEAIDK